MKAPKVSVIIPTKNRLELLKEAVNSVLEQTYSDYELIITDNASTDKTRAWCEALSKKKKRVKYCRNSKDLGMVGNWNSGLAVAKGEYISLLMDDDLWQKNFLKETVRILNKYSKVGFCAVWVDPLYESVSSKKYGEDTYKLYSTNKQVKGINCIKQYLLERWLVGLPSAVLARKEVFEVFGRFDETCLDQEMWLRACQKYNFFYLNKKLCHWRVQAENSFTSNSNLYFSFLSRLRTIDKVKGYQFKNEDLPMIFNWCEFAYKKIGKELAGVLQVNKNDQLEGLFKLYKLQENKKITILKQIIRNVS